MEEARVEVAGLIHEATEPGSCCALVPMLRTIKLIYVEAIFGNLFTKVLLRHDDVPELLKIVTAWAPSGYYYNGDPSQTRQPCLFQGRVILKSDRASRSLQSTAYVGCMAAGADDPNIKMARAKLRIDLTHDLGNV